MAVVIGKINAEDFLKVLGAACGLGLLAAREVHK
jgi:hypothetical protein